MLDVSDRIKYLLNQNSVYKNFRISFPNGEESDICNDRIITESVKFTESMCSQDKLKFGLVESSVLEFETFNVGNIKGATIDAQIEIIPTIASAVAESTSVELGTFTNVSDTIVVLNAEMNPNAYFWVMGYDTDGERKATMLTIWKGDAPFYVDTPKKDDGSFFEYYTLSYKNITAGETYSAYPEKYVIPYGRFIVDSCERQSDNMQRRKVEAYSSTTYDFQIDDMSMVCLESFSWVDDTTDITLYSDDINMLMSQPQDLEMLSDSQSVSYTEKLPAKYNGERTTLTVTIYCYIRSVSVERTKNGLISIELFSDDGWEDEITKIDNMFGFSSYSSLFLWDLHRNARIQAIAYEGYTTDSQTFGTQHTISKYETNKCYTFFGMNTYNNDSSSPKYFQPSVRGIHPYRIVVMDKDSTTTLYDSGEFANGVKHLITDLHTDSYKIWSATYEKKKHLVTNSSTGKSSYRTDYFISNLDELGDKFRDMLEGAVELNGLFGKQDRITNELDYVSLSAEISTYPSDDLYPEDTLYPTGQGSTALELTRDMYSKCWYDDNYTKSYSAVVCKYTNEDDEQVEASYTIVDLTATDDDGNLIYDSSQYQEYDLSDNYLIQNRKFTAEKIDEVLETLAKNIANIRYMPCEVDCVGLPYVEAGDILQIITEESGFEGVILRRTLSGIQSLTDNYESKG